MTAAQRALPRLERPLAVGSIDERLRTHTPVSALGIIHERSPETWSTSLRTGPWLAGSDGIRRNGALAALVDIGVSMPALFARIDVGAAPVTSSLSIEFVPRVAATAALLTTTAELVHSDGVSSAATVGAVIDENDRMVASASVAMRLTPVPEGVESLDEMAPFGADPEIDLDAYLGARSRDDATRAKVEPWHVSPRGTMHGGVVATLAEHVALTAVPGGSAGWETVSMRVDYLRPAMLGMELSLAASVNREGRTLASVDVETRAVDGRLTSLARFALQRR